ncbi:bifunctional [glutamate--ammonia ligase]-adenylyl-L-tyrosine phosphorylase/[glutamate--ammonia-ligase] adenylyltransferase [Zavarzinella formosa]|uniref:bifunctional [glutamate--ammonia ligase]-adenylyl-L-tyrosine phosphorylase/[glutamate--ammonia-ligase] adenylyltransferase n=1 Tax=Zavarzinella formosa TaxID=360055 RepID=UPI0002E22152|nr:bifunctional [glutamate--ammonia ligase]-adenylyl-L-tyrosine phosphorylase/[glutamate--ammonia-ligase] adenylyltransferase [Zavarzinella formosa]
MKPSAVPATLAKATPLLDSWGLEDFARGFRNLQAIGGHLGTGFSAWLPYFTKYLPESPDPDLALNALERILANKPSLEFRDRLFADDGARFGALVQLIGTSQFFGDVLALDPDFLETATAPLRGTPTLDELTETLRQSVNLAGDDNGVLRTIRRFRREQLLRIGVNDIVRDRPLEEITADLSRVADAALIVGWETALRSMCLRYGNPGRACVLAFGKLGGGELNYSSDIDLIVVYDEEGRTTGRRPVGHDEFYSRVVSELIRLLSSHTDRGQAYRVDFRLRPEGQRGALAKSLSNTLSYYDTLGRTWERQALIKVRPVAGDLSLGAEFLEAIQPFVYKRFLSFAEINEIKAMKRKIEQKARQETKGREVKIGAGGIRDIEFTIQFLQLLNGGDTPAVRKRDTLGAMQALEKAGCLTDAEYRGLDDTYRFLRKIEHRLQLLFDLQTHILPESADELRKLALRSGYQTKTTGDMPRAAEPNRGGSSLGAQKHSPLDEPSVVPTLDARDLLVDPLDQFLLDYQEKTRLNRTILNHLLHLTFADTTEDAEPESDLILDPDPDIVTVTQVLGKYGFRDVAAAWRNMMELTQEQRFLSTRRCRHFLANIAPQLLRAVGSTTDPDQALTNLEQVTASLGGKAVLWELFSFNPPSLKLYVDICDSPFLAQILINNPGMIDDLLDSLILNRPRELADLRNELTELLKGADAPDAVESILHSFQDKEILRITVRDLLRKTDVREVTAELSDVAETLFVEVARRQEVLLRERHGDAGPYVILALGKLGGREMSYHSDLDLVLVYAGEGRTAGPKSVDHYEYFTDLARRIIKTLSNLGPMGRLYAVDMRLRPTGKSGSLVVPLGEFQRYFEAKSAQIWERQSLTRSRVLHGDPAFATEMMARVRHAAVDIPWTIEVVREIRQMRDRLEHAGTPRSLRRAAGGMTDIEFLVQAMQIRHGQRLPMLCLTNTWESLACFRDHGLLTPEQHDRLVASYSFHRLAEARLRVLLNRPASEYPESAEELEKFARRMGYPAGDEPARNRFLKDLETHRRDTRLIYDCLVALD